MRFLTGWAGGAGRTLGASLGILGDLGGGGFWAILGGRLSLTLGDLWGAGSLGGCRGDLWRSLRGILGGLGCLGCQKQVVSGTHRKQIVKVSGARRKQIVEDTGARRKPIVKASSSLPETNR